MNKPTTVEINTDELRALVIYSFRYAMGRQTYAVQEVVEALLKYWDHLEDRDQALIVKEISTEITRGNYGMDIDLKQWQRVLVKGRKHCQEQLHETLTECNEVQDNE